MLCCAVLCCAYFQQTFSLTTNQSRFQAIKRPTFGNLDKKIRLCYKYIQYTFSIHASGIPQWYCITVTKRVQQYGNVHRPVMYTSNRHHTASFSIGQLTTPVLSCGKITHVHITITITSIFIFIPTELTGALILANTTFLCPV